MAERRSAFLDRFFDAVDRLNYRVVYVILFVILAVPFVVGFWQIPERPRVYAEGLYNAIEECAATGKPVFLINAWLMSSKGENQPQFEVILDHMMQRGVKFVMLSLNPVTAIYGHDLCVKYAEHYGRRYGVDWIDFGFRDIYSAGWKIWLDNMETQGLVGSFRTDYHRHDLGDFDSLPIMRVDAGAEQKELAIRDFGLILEVSYVGTIPQLIGLIRPKYLKEGVDIKMGIGTVAMILPQMLPYFDSGDLAGVLGGLKGASEYSALLKEGPSIPRVRDRMGAYAMALLFVLFAIVLGNVSTVWKWWRTRRQGHAER